MKQVRCGALLFLVMLSTASCKKNDEIRIADSATTQAKVSLVAGNATASGTNDHSNPLDARFNRLGKITWDHRNNTLYLLDGASTSALRKLDDQGVSTIANAALGVFNEGYDISLAPQATGTLYVTTSMGQLMNVNTNLPFNSSNPQTIIDWVKADGSPKTDGNKTGSLDEAAISGGHGLAMAPDGKIYFANSHYLTVHRINFQQIGHEVDAFAGKPTAGVSAPAFPFADGPGDNATFGSIGDMDADQAGNIYVADPEYCTLRKIDAGGTVSSYLTPAPNTHTYYINTDGTLATARAGKVNHVAVSDDGRIIYFATPGTLRAIIPAADKVVTIAKFNDTINSIATTPDGKTVYVACNYAVYKVTDIRF